MIIITYILEDISCKKQVLWIWMQILLLIRKKSNKKQVSVEQIKKLKATIS